MWDGEGGAGVVILVSRQVGDVEQALDDAFFDWGGVGVVGGEDCCGHVGGEAGCVGHVALQSRLDMPGMKLRGKGERTVRAVMLRMMVLEMTLGPVQDGLLKRRLVCGQTLWTGWIQLNSIWAGEKWSAVKSDQ